MDRCQQTSREQDKMYAAVTKRSKDIPKLVSGARTALRQDSIIQLNSNTSFKILSLTVQAHLINLARPGTFGMTMQELLRLNNLPDVVYLDDAPSPEIFGVIKNAQSPDSDMNIINMSDIRLDESDLEAGVDVKVDTMESDIEQLAEAS